MRYTKCWLPVVAVVILSGCAEVPADRGMGDVQALLRERGAPQSASASDDVIAMLLAAPLTPQRAMSIALMRNPELRIEYARLGLAQADVFEAGRLSNPQVRLSALDSNAAGESMRLGFGLVQNFTDLLLLRARSSLARGELEQEQARVAERIRSLAVAVNAAAVQAISATQVSALRDIIARSARASADLAQRFFDAGNINELELNRERAAATEAALAADGAQANAETSRWALNRLMGLRAEERRWTLDSALPVPVSAEDPLAALQSLALAQRLDLDARQREVTNAAAAADLVQRWRWLPFLAVGVEGEREADGTHFFGPTLSLALPIFNQGQGRMLRAQGLVELAQAELAQLELDIQAQVADAYQRMLAARGRTSRHVTDLIPQRKAIVASTQELQNFMLVGQFELILARQQEYDAYQSYLEAVRDYWLARVDLEHAVGTALPSDARIESATVEPIRLSDPGPGVGHQEHGMHELRNGDPESTPDAAAGDDGAHSSHQH